jgi:hypothetical protein
MVGSLIASGAGSRDRFSRAIAVAHSSMTRSDQTEDSRQAPNDTETHELYELALEPKHIPIEVEDGELVRKDDEAVKVSDEQGFHTERRRIVCSCGQTFDSKEWSSSNDLKIRRRAFEHLKEHLETGVLTFDARGNEYTQPVLDDFHIDCSDGDWTIHVDGEAVYCGKQAPGNIKYQRPNSPDIPV